MIDTEDQERKLPHNGTNETILPFKFIDVKGNHNYVLQLGHMFQTTYSFKNEISVSLLQL